MCPFRLQWPRAKRPAPILYGCARGDFEKITEIPGSLKRSPGFADRGSLPHPNEIAVDSLDRPAGHQLFPDVPSYQAQFNLRKDTAMRHLEVVHAGWKGR